MSLADRLDTMLKEHIASIDYADERSREPTYREYRISHAGIPSAHVVHERTMPVSDSIGDDEIRPDSNTLTSVYLTQPDVIALFNTTRPRGENDVEYTPHDGMTWNELVSRKRGYHPRS